jgi:low temperature requirement protein LtrA
MKHAVENVVYMALVITIWWAIWSFNDAVTDYLNKKYGYNNISIYIFILLFVIIILSYSNLHIVI